MDRDRRTWLMIGMVFTAAAAVALTAISLAGFAAVPAGDLMVSSTAAMTNVMLAIGAAAFLGLELRTHRPARRATTPATQPARK
jgi:carbon starvation protein CstA